MATSLPRGAYEQGEQPCAQFQEHDEGWGGNVHDCFGPYPALPGPRCAASVSFCDACLSDHHVGGWQACAAPPA